MMHKENVKKALDEAILFVDSRGYGGVAHIMQDALDLLKEQEEEIENLKQAAQSMMEGIEISTSMFYPCESCQEFNCDFCKFKRTYS